VKRVATLFVGASLGPGLISCGRETPSSGEFRVAALLTGPISDDGWNASALEGLELIEGELGAKIAKVESLDKNQFEESFREFGARGYDLIFGHAYEFQDAALRVAKDFPKTTFIVIAGNVSAENVGSVHFKLEEATYPLGALAAKLSNRPVAGMIGGEEIVGGGLARKDSGGRPREIPHRHARERCAPRRGGPPRWPHRRGHSSPCRTCAAPREVCRSGAFPLSCGREMFSGSLFFGLAMALQVRMQGRLLLGTEIPNQFFQMLPYALTLGVLVLGARGGAGAPAALARAFRSGR
jgi:hypothetical protein